MRLFPFCEKRLPSASYWLSPPPLEKTNTWRRPARTITFARIRLFASVPRPSESRTQERSGSGRRRELSTRATRLPPQRAKAFQRKRSFFSILKKAAACPRRITLICTPGLEGLAEAGYRSGAYCSGIPIKEEPGVTITTADDIRAHAPSADFVYFVFNDVCPPSPGCTFPQNPPAPATSGIPYAALWQYAQSPRRMERTAHCAPGYHADGNCYAPGDTAHAWFLDADTAKLSRSF